MKRLCKQSQIAQAEEEITAEFGEVYIDYAHDLFLLRHAAAHGFSPRCIYDIGGSSGIWSAIMQRVFPEVTFEIFEPLADICQEYVAMRESHPTIRALFGGGRSSLHPVALSDSSKKASMTVYPHAVGSTTISLDYKPENATFVDVPAWSLDEYIRAKRLASPDLLKIDTQGSELEILRGATNAIQKSSAILCECWLFRGYGSNTPLWNEIATYLSQFDFHPFDFGWTYRRPSDQRSATEDIFFLKSVVPFSPLYGRAS
jgi:FkbM family methyltransferase